MSTREILLAQAENCPNPECNDSGFSVHEVSIAVCCGMPHPNGECCGNPVEGFEAEQEQCEFCYENPNSVFNVREKINES